MSFDQRDGGPAFPFIDTVVGGSNDNYRGDAGCGA